VERKPETKVDEIQGLDFDGLEDDQKVFFRASILGGEIDIPTTGKVAKAMERVFGDDHMGRRARLIRDEEKVVVVLRPHDQKREDGV